MNGTPIQQELVNALQERNLEGWSQLALTDFANEFQKITLEKGWSKGELTSQGLQDVCFKTCPDGDSLLYALIEALAPNGAGTKPRTEISPLVLRILRAICAVGIERWVVAVMNQLTQLPLPLTPPDLSKNFSLQIDDEWAVYLMAACQLGLKMNFPSQPSERPPSLLKALSPDENLRNSTTEWGNAAVHDALLACTLSTSVVRPSKAYVKGMMPTVHKHLNSTPVFGVRSDDPGNPLHEEKTRQYAYQEFGVPTVTYGATTPCEQSLKDFEQDLRSMIDTLHAYLNQPINATTGDHPMKTDAKRAAGDTYHFHAPVGVVGEGGNAAQAIGQQSQATLGNITNHGSGQAAFDALLSTFLTEINASPALAGRQAVLAERLADLKQLATHADQSPDTVKKVKGYIADIKMVTDGLEQGSKLVTAGQAIVAGCVTYWPALAQLFGTATKLVGGG